MAVKVTKPQVDLREEINQALTLSGLENQSIIVNGLESKGKVQIGRNPRGYTGGHLFVHNDAGLDSTTKAELSDNAVLLLQPHSSNSTHMAIGQVNGGNGMGIQVTNASRTANWDIALNPFGGAVGIGTDSPTSKLTVDSNISSSSTTVIDILQSTNGADKQVAGIGVLVDNGGESTNAGGMFFQTASGGALTERLRLTSSGSLELGYSGAARQQADSQALSIITPATGGGQGIALKRLDSNSDQQLGEITFSNNTQDGLGGMRMKTSGAVNTTQLNFDIASSGAILTPLKVESGPNTVVINGTTADTGTTGGSRGLSIATAGGTSCPIYFGSETNSAQKSMYMTGYWIYLRGHQNEGIRFVFSQGAGSAPRSDQYEFKYNSAYRPTGNTTWDGFSDGRAKENVQDMTGALDTISQLRPVVFDWTDDYADAMNMFEMDTTDEHSYNHISVKENGYDLTRKNGKIGFIAQEFETVFPKDITQLEVQLGDEKVEDFKTVNYDSLIPTLTKAIQEQQAQIQALQQRLDDLEG